MLLTPEVINQSDYIQAGQSSITPNLIDSKSILTETGRNFFSRRGGSVKPPPNQIMLEENPFMDN
jgi:hypothetical protein